MTFWIYWPIITWLLQLVRILLLIYSKDLSSLQKSLFLLNQHRISQVKSRKQQFNLTLFAKRNLLRQRKHFYVKNEPTENYYYCIIRNIFLIQYFITLASSGTTPNEEKYIKKRLCCPNFSSGDCIRSSKSVFETLVFT